MFLQGLKLFKDKSKASSDTKSIAESCRYIKYRLDKFKCFRKHRLKKMQIINAIV